MLNLKFVLVVLFALLYASAYIGGRANPARTSRANRRRLRFTSAFLALVALAFCLLRLSGEAPMRAYGLLIGLGMTLSFVADLYTGGLVKARQPYLMAMAFFGLAHCCYITAFFVLHAFLGFSIDSRVLVASESAAAGIWWILLRRPKNDAKGFNNLSLLYALALGAMVGSAVSAGLQASAFRTLIPGALLFTASDVMLGFREIQKRSWPYMYDIIWAAYILGQGFIVASLA